MQLNLPPEETNPQQSVSNPSPEVKQTDEDFVNEFLKNVAPEDLPAVEKYYKEWGAKVTQSSQQKSAELQRYLDLGVDYDSIVAAVNLMMFGDQNPLALYQQLEAYLKEEGLLEMPTEQGNEEVDPMFEGASPEMVKQFTELKQKADKFESFMTQVESERTNAAGQAELDKMMKELHTKHGDFDEMAILARIMNGMKPDEAVKDFTETISKNYNPKPKAPPVIGGGRTAVDQVDSSKMKDKATRKQYIQSILGGID
jgi:hypothetical protein